MLNLMRYFQFLLLLIVSCVFAPASSAVVHSTRLTVAPAKPTVQPAAIRTPAFEDYVVGRIYKSAGAPARIINKEQFAFRTRISNASRGPTNFAGHYRFDTWGCGTSCLQGAIVDLLTGDVSMLPFSICCYYGNNDMAEYRVNSQLIIFRGLRNEEGKYGIHFYKFDNGSFSYLTTIEENKDEQINGVNALKSNTVSPSTASVGALATAISKKNGVSKFVLYNAECGEDYGECVVADIGCSASEGFFANVSSFDDKTAGGFLSSGDRSGSLQVGSQKIELKVWRLEYSDMNGDWDISLRLEKDFDSVWRLASSPGPVTLKLGHKTFAVPNTVASQSNYKEIVKTCTLGKK